MFLLAFTSADIIFHKVLELHSTLSEKNIFMINFRFLTDSLKPSPHSLNSQNLLSMANISSRCSLIQLLKNLRRRVTLLFPLIVVEEKQKKHRAKSVLIFCLSEFNRYLTDI